MKRFIRCLIAPAKTEVGPRYSARCLVLCLSLLLCSNFALSEDRNSNATIDLAKLLKNGSIRVEQEDGTPVMRYRDTEQFVPASILKVATTFCAMESLGNDYHFETPFFLGEHNTLFIQGSGDPSLVSETIDLIAAKIAKSMPRIDHIVIDTSFFDDDISIDGSERSLNPYDAKNASFVGNFSSAHITRTKSGKVISAETQTPITPLSLQAGLRLPRGRTERINLSSNWKVGVLYAGELFMTFLRKHGATGLMQLERGRVSPHAKEIYRHRSPQSLEEIAQAMLKYSTNFTANQFFLVLGAHRYGAPATVEKGQRAMTDCLSQRIGWRGFHIEEGSGLSRSNSVNAAQMTALLKSFEKYKFLLPETDGFLAKTGSLRGVNSLAGYFVVENYPTPLRFTILINSEVPHLYKYTVAKAIRDYLNNDNIKTK